MANPSQGTGPVTSGKKERKKPIRGTPEQRFAKAVFSQLRPAMAIAMGRLKAGQAIPASVVAKAGELTAAIIAWGQDSNK